MDHISVCNTEVLMTRQAERQKADYYNSRTCAMVVMYVAYLGVFACILVSQQALATFTNKIDK